MWSGSLPRSVLRFHIMATNTIEKFHHILIFTYYFYLTSNRLYVYYHKKLMNCRCGLYVFLIAKKQTARLFDKINTKIDLDSPKVATMDKLSNGDKKVYCRCWQSGTFPLCDGSHMAHNKETGDNVGPLIVSVDKAEE